MTCAECDKEFQGRDYLCDRCRRKENNLPNIARYDSEGYNQWGTKYSGKCSCGSDYPCNMMGMGFCPYCETQINPLQKEVCGLIELR